MKSGGVIECPPVRRLDDSGPPGGGPPGLPPGAPAPYGPDEGPDDTWGYRCTICNLDFPPDERFALCPSCEQPTHPGSNLNPMPMAEAMSLKNHAEFERYYERTRGVSADGD